MANSASDNSKYAGPNTGGIQMLPGGAYNRDDDALDLKRVLDTLFSRWKIIVGATALAGLLALLYLAFAKPSYVATTHLLIESRQPKIISGNDIAPGLDTGRYVIGQVIESQIQLLKSPRIAERVIERLRQKQLQTPVNALTAANDVGDKDAITRGLNTKTPLNTELTKNAEKPLEHVIETLPPVSQREIGIFLRKLDVRRLGQSLIIQVSYAHENRKMAAKISNYIASAYLSEQQESRSEKNAQVRKWLQARVIELQTSTRNTQRNIQTYKAKHDLIDTGGQLLSERELGETIKQSIEAKTQAEAILAQIRQNEILEAANKKPGASGLSLKSNVIDDLKQQFAQVNRKLATAVSRFGQNHPSVYTFRAEIANLKQEIEREEQRLVYSLGNDYKVAIDRAKQLDERVKVLNTKLTKGRKLTIKLAEMKYEAKVSNDLYELLLSRLRETELRASLQRADSRVVRVAKAPEKPASPKKLLTLAGSLFAGFALSFSVAILGEFMGNAIRSAGDVRRYLGYNKVVSLPLLSSHSKNASDGESRELVAGHSMQYRSSEYEQQIFLLNENLRKNRPDDGGQVVTFISALEGEGKTVTAVNLANYTASIGVKTLLIDCDLHDADATTVLHPQPQHSLIDIVNGGKKMDQVIVKDDETGLCICPATLSPTTIRPMDILASTRMSNFLRDAKKEFQLIILDTPALDKFVDARSLVDAADSIVLILESNRATAATIKETIEPIAEHRSKIHGIALNKIPQNYGLNKIRSIAGTNS